IYPGDRVAILGKNRHQWVTAFYAAAKADAITVPLNWRLHPAELAYLLENSGAAVLVYDSEFTELVDKMRADIPVKSYVRIGGEGPDIEFEEALQGRATEEPCFTSGGEDTAIIMYTSGTTGNPKGAMLTHNNMFFVTAGHCHTISWKYKDRFLSIAPLFHIGGLAPMLTNIHCGASCVFLADFNPVKVWELVVQEKITFMMTVPAMAAAMLMVPGIDKMDLSSLEHIVCGGSPVPESIIIKYKELGIEVENVLGITEYAGAVTFWTHDMGWDKHTSVGKVIFHGDLKIVELFTRKELPSGQTGELCVMGPQVFKGYWNNPDATSKVLVGGCYYSGDLGVKDEDGFIYIVDRLKDMIISGGENIYSVEIEAVIAKHPAVAEVAVVGKPDDKWGEVPVAFVVKAAHAQVSAEDIMDFCSQSLAKFKCVKEVIFIDALPRNAVGKLKKNVLREQLKKN
ncbi:MAG: acyl-CoA synthetase (AMP-forming)/AMP-acid ligase, partial [Firmicutes bacterium]|nr:acyl-CoA synthetase (AMP-forming)/AMP-acid ligase [Bacillota bacterium]